MRVQKLGGYASIILAGIIIVNILILLIIFQEFTLLDIYDPVKMMTAYNTYTIAFRVYDVLGVFTGVLIAFIALVLQERMQARAPQLMRLAALRTHALPRILGYIILACGIVEFLVKVSKIEIAIPIGLFLGLIVFTWIGVVLLREQQPGLTAQETA
jgi:hypothetical protein